MNRRFARDFSNSITPANMNGVGGCTACAGTAGTGVGALDASDKRTVTFWVFGSAVAVGTLGFAIASPILTYAGIAGVMGSMAAFALLPTPGLTNVTKDAT